MVLARAKCNPLVLIWLHVIGTPNRSSQHQMIATYCFHNHTALFPLRVLKVVIFSKFRGKNGIAVHNQRHGDTCLSNFGVCPTGAATSNYALPEVMRALYMLSSGTRSKHRVRSFLLCPVCKIAILDALEWCLRKSQSDVHVTSSRRRLGLRRRMAADECEH